MSGLSKSSIAAAKRMKGTNSKNLFKRAWKIQKGKASRPRTGTKSTTRKRQSRPSSGGSRMAKRKTRRTRKGINVSLSDLAGVAIAADLIGAKMIYRDITEESGSIANIPHVVAQNLTDRDRLVKHGTPLLGIAALKMFLGRRQIGKLGPLRIKV